MLVSDGKTRGPSLPRWAVNSAGERVTWHPSTRRWWDSWRKSPQSIRMMTEPDWAFMLDTAILHHLMWSEGQTQFAAEIRLRVGKFGATPEDRSRLRVEIGTGLPSDPARTQPGVTGSNVTNIDPDRRARIVGES